MIHMSLDPTQPKGWFVGPWNSAVPVPVGFATVGINEPHYHTHMYEIYLVARGTSTAMVNDAAIALRADDVLVVEPHEPHTFTHSSTDYVHFVVHAPFVPNDKIHVTER